MALFDFFRRKPKPARRQDPAPVAAAASAPVPATDPVTTEADDFLPDRDQAGLPEQAQAATPEHDGPERRGRNRRNARAGSRMLVIDDSPTIVALLKRMLQQNQYEVLEAFDAESGIEIARREVPDLIFLDIVLPGMDGFNALRTLRRDPATRDVPIIMISGNAQATEQFYVQRIGADDFMKKPFSRAEVFNRIEALLDADDIPRHHARPRTRAEAAAAALDAGPG